MNSRHRRIYALTVLAMSLLFHFVFGTQRWFHIPAAAKGGRHRVGVAAFQCLLFPGGHIVIHFSIVVAVSVSVTMRMVMLRFLFGFLVAMTVGMVVSWFFLFWCFLWMPMLCGVRVGEFKVRPKKENYKDRKNKYTMMWSAEHLPRVRDHVQIPSFWEHRANVHAVKWNGRFTGETSQQSKRQSKRQ